MSKVGSLWTDEEIEFLKTNYKTMTNQEIGEVLDRGEGGVSHQIRKLKLSRATQRGWPEEKIKFLKENYGEMSTEKIAERLGCHPRTVTSRAYQMGLNAKREKRCPRCGKMTGDDGVHCPTCKLQLHTRADCHNCAELDGTSCRVFTTRDSPPLNKYGVCHGRKMAPARSKGPTKLTNIV